MKVFFLLLAFAFGTLLPPPLSAQPCLSNKPAPACRSFFITEFGYGYKATSPLHRRAYEVFGNSSSFYEDEITGRHLLSSELGLMRNLNADYGFGATHFFGWDVGRQLHGGVKLRMRKWLSDKESIDLSGGLLLWGTNAGVFEYPSFVGGASLNFSDWESFNLTVTTLNTQSYDYTYYYEGVSYRSFSPRQNEIGVYVGYKLSSKPGLVFNAASLTAFAVVLGFFLASGPFE